MGQVADYQENGGGSHEEDMSNLKEDTCTSPI